MTGVQTCALPIYDDEIAAEAKDGAENLSDEEYARRLREEGGK